MTAAYLWETGKTTQGDGMTEIEQKLREKLERRAWNGEPMKERFTELIAENDRLQRIVAELLMRNQQLREAATHSL
jgi:hypothetical protein